MLFAPFSCTLLFPGIKALDLKSTRAHSGKFRDSPPPHTYSSHSKSPFQQVLEETNIKTVFVPLFSENTVFVACHLNSQEASVIKLVAKVSGEIVESVEGLVYKHDLSFTSSTRYKKALLRQTQRTPRAC